MSTPLARSNRKSHWEVTARGLTFTETCHGGGMGAWSKMADRINERLFGTINVSWVAHGETEEGITVVTLRCNETQRRLVVVIHEVQS
jgi:hypothetical protein